ncbi:hypothetical protein TNCV_4287211 [Trichonephila clavipes]|nr:hypothetical protein TNCV_4287211 [Trichonephila clavipes]
MRRVRYATDCHLSDGGRSRSLWQGTSNLHLSLAVALCIMQVTPHERAYGSIAILCTPIPQSTIHLQSSMPSPVTRTRSNGTAVSVTNHYTRWVPFAAV